MAGESSGEAAAGSVVMVVIILATACVFLVLMFVVVRCRRRSLGKAVAAVLDTTNNSQLPITPNDLGRLHDTAKATWDRRANTFPIPEPRRLPDGWIHDEDDRPIAPRVEIEKSAQQIWRAAADANEKYSRRKRHTVRQLLKMLREDGVGHVDRQTCDAYLGFYETARYSSPNRRFTPEQYGEFRAVFRQLLQQILGDANES